MGTSLVPGFVSPQDQVGGLLVRGLIFRRRRFFGRFQVWVIRENTVGHAFFSGKRTSDDISMLVLERFPISGRFLRLCRVLRQASLFSDIPPMSFPKVDFCAVSGVFRIGLFLISGG